MKKTLAISLSVSILVVVSAFLSPDSAYASVVPPSVMKSLKGEKSVSPKPKSKPTVEPSTRPSEMPKATPTEQPGPDRNQAAQEIIEFYNVKGTWAGQNLLQKIISMSLKRNDEENASACVSYTSSFYDMPDVADQNDTRTFSLELGGGHWNVVAMGDNQSCIVDEKTAFVPILPVIPQLPERNKLTDMIIAYYKTKGEWAGQYLIQHVNSIHIKPPYGDYQRACVAYDAALVQTPSN